MCLDRRVVKLINLNFNSADVVGTCKSQDWFLSIVSMLRVQFTKILVFLLGLHSVECILQKMRWLL
jgi:hypothetical protein